MVPYILQPYLIPSALEHRKSLCELRSNAHYLMVEKGRYKISIESSGYVMLATKKKKKNEDEIHFLDKCRHVT